MTPNPGLRRMFKAAGLAVRDRGPVRENPLAYLNRAWGPSDVAWVEQLLVDADADLLHVHTFASHIVGVRAALRHGLPVVRTEHGVAHYRNPSCWPFRRWALERTDCVIAVSGFVARFVAHRFPCAKPRLRIVRNGVDASYFRPQPRRDEGPFTFCVVSRLEAVKRIDFALRAVARVPQIRLCIAGDGSERKPLERLAARLGITDRVRFLGYLADPRSVIADSHAAINSKREEELGLSILEALAMGRPVVAFVGGGVTEIVRDRETGWLVRDDSVEALAAALREASGSKERAGLFGEQGRISVEQHCRVEAMCDGYAQIYAELAAMRVGRLRW
jgi:glycosyltransferase involved in cell wall biosynthesis